MPVTTILAAAADRPTVSWRRIAACLIPGLLLAIYYESVAWHTAGVLGFPLDDAWIHAQFARNLATGHGFTYTGGRWVAGSTSPAWTLLLALGYLIARSVLISAKLLGIALQLGCGLLAARLAWQLCGVAPLALSAGTLVVVAPAMVWGAVSGMESGLASALVLGGFCLYLDQRGGRFRIAGLFVLALACLARPETLVVFGIVAVHFVVRASRPRLRAFLTIVLVAGIVLGPFVLFDYFTIGRPLPTTFYAKSGPGVVRAVVEGNGNQLRRLLLVHGPNAVWKFGETMFDQFGVSAVVLILGTAAALTRPLRQRGGWLVASCVLVAAYAIGVVAPQRLKPENFRYTAQMLSLAAVLGLAGLSGVWAYLNRTRLQVAVIAIIVSVVGIQSVRRAPTYALSVKNIQELHIRLADWIQGHLPPGTTVAVNDVGALAYFGNHDVIDLEGLVSPEALAYPRAQRGLGVTFATRPDYVAIFPGWYPDISGRPDLFHEVYRTEISDNVVSAGAVLILYSTPWTRFPPVLRSPAGTRRHRWPA